MEYCGGGSLQDMYQCMYHLHMYFDVFVDVYYYLKSTQQEDQLLSQ